MLGARQVRRWATVVVLAGTSDAPHQLLVTGLVRAGNDLVLVAGYAGSALVFATFFMRSRERLCPIARRS